MLENMFASHKNTTLVELHLKICWASDLISSICFVRVFPSLGIAWCSEPSKCSTTIGTYAMYECLSWYFERHLSKERLKSATKPRQDSRWFVGTNLQFSTIYVVFYSLDAIPPTVRSSGWTNDPGSPKNVIIILVITCCVGEHPNVNSREHRILPPHPW